MTIYQLYNDFVLRLQSLYDHREADNIADWVFEKLTGFKRWQRREEKNTTTSAETVTCLNAYLEQLLKHKPVQYVLNEAWFYKMKFYVNEYVLIPRPETEELVSWIINDVKRSGKKEQVILDIGTGSGCIAISLKKNIDNCSVDAIDISNEALAVAKKNADDLHENINFLKADFLNEPFSFTVNRYDVLVSNPPYIPLKEKNNIAKNVIAFEPPIALFVNDNDPFIFCKKIAKFSLSHLKENGKIYVEIHESYSKETASAFHEYGFITEIKKDIYGKERMIKAYQ